MNKLALIYDFDKTLSPKDMQEFHLIPSLGYKKPSDFWSECGAFSKEQNADGILSYMYKIIEKNPSLKKSDLIHEGKYITLYKGVDTWFKRINAYGKKRGIEVEHYIISSGLREMIAGTSIAKEFKKIYACHYAYDKDGTCIWPTRAVNYTMKTQFLYRINKGVLDETNDFDLNRKTPEDEKYIPFTNMVYFGDGLTDVPSMKCVTSNGGTAVAVYDSKVKKEALALELKKDKRANFAFDADYSNGSKIDKAVKCIIDTMVLKNKLEELK